MNAKKYTTLTTIFSLLIMVFVLSACISAKAGTPDPQDPLLTHTQAAEQVSLLLTQQAGEAAVARLTQIAQETAQNPLPTATSQPVEPTATPTLPPTTAPTAVPTATPLPPTPTATPLPCNLASFIKDVAVKDGTVFGPEDEFVKTWRLQNVGSCTWTDDYELVFSSGSKMSGASRIALGESVRPGETVDVSVALVAPEDEGSYTGYWMLRSDDGDLFGVGAAGNTAFWVKIWVDKPDEVAYDFTDNACDASWKSGAGILTCPDTTENSTTGFVNVVDHPVLESGRTENEPALVVHPDGGDKGNIVGRYEPITIKRGDHFMAVVGCMDDSDGCSVTFELSYRADGSGLRSLATWKETYDGKFQKIDINLSEFAGMDVELYLIVNADGSAENDYAFWLFPRIMR